MVADWFDRPRPPGAPTPGEDLCDLITRKQDELRGRPRNWRDDLGDWWRYLDWEQIAFRVVMAFWCAATLALWWAAFWPRACG